MWRVLRGSHPSPRSGHHRLRQRRVRDGTGAERPLPAGRGDEGLRAGRAPGVKDGGRSGESGPGGLRAGGVPVPGDLLGAGGTGHRPVAGGEPSPVPAGDRLSCRPARSPGVDSLLLFRPTVKTEALPPEARSAAICYLRGKRSEGLKLPTSSYIIVSGESGEVDARVSKGRFRLYRR